MTWKEFAIEEIKRIGERNNLSPKLIDDAISKYRNLKKSGLFLGFLHSQIGLAILFLVCKENRVETSLESLDLSANSFDQKTRLEFVEKRRKIRLEKARKLINKIDKTRGQSENEK